MKKRTALLLIPLCIFFTFKISAAFYPSASKMLGMFSEVFSIVKNQYVEEVSDAKLIEGAISGMLTSLDPHSSYLTPAEYDDIKASAKGEFGGLGIEIVVDGGLTIIAPIDDTPAYFAGIKAGDRILAVDDILVSSITPNEAISKIRGPKGTKVKISIERKDEKKILEFLLTRENIQLKTVKWHIYDNVAYVRISSFVGNTASSLKKAIYSIKQKKNIRGLVLDLRSNPGGMLNQAIDVVELFLEDGIVVSTKGRNKKDNEIYKAHKGQVFEEVPIIVLINGGSASASEIVAGALQDHKKATIMGTKSYGKASVQSIIPIPPLGAIRLSTALYYTPSGKLIQKEGIIPDIIIEPVLKKEKIEKNFLNENEMWKKLFEQDLQLQKAIKLIENINIPGLES